MILFVIGPSGVGKTTLLAKVYATLPVEKLDLDAEDGPCAEWDPGWEGRRWLRDMKRLAQTEERAKANINIVVDVGAGSLQTPDGRSYFRDRADQTIAVFAPWETVLNRRHPDRAPNEFRAIEYSPERLALYEGAKLKVNTGSKSTEESAADLIHAIRTLLEGSHGA